MKSAEFSGIRPETTKKILNIIAGCDAINRADIADAAHISVMTAGKGVDALLGAGLVSERKTKCSDAGRRVGMLSLMCKKHAIVLDLSERSFRMNIVDQKLGICDSMRYTYNKRFYYDENLYAFLKNVRAYLDRRNDLSDIYGVGISVPGKYINDGDRIISAKIPELESIPLKSTVERMIGQGVTLITKNVEAAALSYASQLSGAGDRVVVYLYIGESIDGAVYNFGEFLKGANGCGCDFGAMRTRHGQTLEERVRACRNDLMIADELSDTVYNLIAIYDPDVFIIESDILREPELFIENISDTLFSVCKLPADRMPQFLSGTREARQTARGVAMMLREMWIDRLFQS